MEFGLEFIETSAKTGTNIDEALLALVNIILNPALIAEGRDCQHQIIHILWGQAFVSSD